jgi:TPR repeat protein
VDTIWNRLFDQRFVCGRQPSAEEGVALLEKAAGQGHAYAMCELGGILQNWKEHEKAVEWLTKAAVAGLPKAMVGPGRYCSPRQPTHFESSFLEFNGIL